MTTRNSLALLVAVALTVPAETFALAAEISSPQIGHRSGIAESQKKRVYALVDHMREKLTFIEGNFINEFSHQRLGGKPTEAAACIQMAKDVGIWNVQVQFRDYGEQETAFALDQNSATGIITFTVNAGRDDFLLKHFAAHLPGPNLTITTKKR